MIIAIEGGLAVLALVLAFTVPNLGSRWFEAVERSFGRLARRRGLSVLMVGLVALALRAALLPVLPVPQPGVRDEYCYLLLSDTFAHGRLTNPTNPMWAHFVSPFILWHPTYTTKYWPAQGLIMALGQAVAGHPFWGVWLSVGLMCAAITWMLQGWIGEGWALLGGLLVMIRLGTFNYWANSYWGGAVTAIGGALVLGALPRLKHKPRVRHALMMGLGFAILGNSRPYEGLFFGIPVAVALLVWLWKMKRPDLARALKHAVVPLLAVLAMTLIAMGYYFWRTMGSPWVPPYLVYAHTYNPVPSFPWLPAKPMPAFHSPQLRLFFLSLKKNFYDPTQTIPGLTSNILIKFILMWTFFLGPVFTLPIVLLPMVLPLGFSWKDISRDTRFLLAACGAVILANLPVIYYEPHYTAPATCAIVALLLITMHNVRRYSFRGRATGLFVTRAVPSICILLMALLAAAGPLHLPFSPAMAGNDVPTWCWQSLPNLDQAAVLSRLRTHPGGQLAIVRERATGFEWVYNKADLNSAKVIWAHDMGPAKNQELIRYFKDRRAWLVDANVHPPKLVPYSETADTMPDAGSRAARKEDPVTASGFSRHVRSLALDISASRRGKSR